MTDNAQGTAGGEQAMYDLRNLLAVIHRDGGHYFTDHGQEKAVEDAIQAVVQERTNAATAASEIARLTQENHRLRLVDRDEAQRELASLGLEYDALWREAEKRTEDTARAIDQRDTAASALETFPFDRASHDGGVTWQLRWKGDYDAVMVDAIRPAILKWLASLAPKEQQS